MQKQRISKADLACLFRQRMNQHPECPLDVVVEIKQVKTSEGLSWSAATKQADTLAYIDCARIVGALTIELRPAYEVIDV